MILQQPLFWILSICLIVNQSAKGDIRNKRFGRELVEVLLDGEIGPDLLIPSNLHRACLSLFTRTPADTLLKLQRRFPKLWTFQLTQTQDHEKLIPDDPRVSSDDIEYFLSVLGPGGIAFFYDPFKQIASGLQTPNKEIFRLPALIFKHEPTLNAADHEALHFLIYTGVGSEAYPAFVRHLTGMGERAKLQEEINESLKSPLLNANDEKSLLFQLNLILKSIQMVILGNSFEELIVIRTMVEHADILNFEFLTRLQHLFYYKENYNDIVFAMDERKRMFRQIKAQIYRKNMNTLKVIRALRETEAIIAQTEVWQNDFIQYVVRPAFPDPEMIQHFEELR